jgi:hypothetical protein
MRAQPGAQQRPTASLNIDMHLVNAIAFVISGKFVRAMIHTLVRIPSVDQPVVNGQTIDIDGRAGQHHPALGPASPARYSISYTSAHRYRVATATAPAWFLPPVSCARGSDATFAVGWSTPGGHTCLLPFVPGDQIYLVTHPTVPVTREPRGVPGARRRSPATTTNNY